MVEQLNNKRIVYSPKRLVFQVISQNVRTALAVLDNNFNSDREQAKTRQGVPKFKLQTNRSGSKWFVKTIKNDNSYEIMDEIRSMVIQCFDQDFVPEVEFPIDKNIPRNMARVPRPSKEDAISKHVSRFEKN